MIKIQFHKAPDGYHYERTEFKRNVHAIWIVNESHFDYCGCSNIKSIWGFVHEKTKQFYAPINSKTIGKCVKIEDTTPYSAMKKLKPCLTDTV